MEKQSAFPLYPVFQGLPNQPYILYNMFMGDDLWTDRFKPLFL